MQRAAGLACLVDPVTGRQLRDTEAVSDSAADGHAARYLDAVGNPHYDSAFSKMVMDPTTGHLRFTPQEVEAVRIVSAVGAERVLVMGTGYLLG